MLPGVVDLDGYGQVKQPPTAKKEMLSRIRSERHESKKEASERMERDCDGKGWRSKSGAFLKSHGKSLFYLCSRRKERTRLCIA
jgi:hypothetical protein